MLSILKEYSYTPNNETDKTANTVDTIEAADTPIIYKTQMPHKLIIPPKLLILLKYEENKINKNNLALILPNTIK